VSDRDRRPVFVLAVAFVAIAVVLTLARRRECGRAPTGTARVQAGDRQRTATGPARPELDAAKREAVRRAIMRTWSIGDTPQQSGSAPSSPWTAVDLDGGSLAPAYIRARIRDDYAPLAKD
jgi:hypothetical protein